MKNPMKNVMDKFNINIDDREELKRELSTYRHVRIFGACHSGRSVTAYVLACLLTRHNDEMALASRDHGLVPLEKSVKKAKTLVVDGDTSPEVACFKNYANLDLLLETRLLPAELCRPGREDSAIKRFCAGADCIVSLDEESDMNDIIINLRTAQRRYKINAKKKPDIFINIPVTCGENKELDLLATAVDRLPQSHAVEIAKVELLGVSHYTDTSGDIFPLFSPNSPGVNHTKVTEEAMCTTTTVTSVNGALPFELSFRSDTSILTMPTDTPRLDGCTLWLIVRVSL